MKNKSVDKEEIIKKIVTLEWNMFSSVIASEPNSCQDDMKTFKIMRWMSYSVITPEILLLVLDNISNAFESGRNLMTEKYGRMEGIISSLNESYCISEIAEIELNWMQEVHNKYPLTFKGGDEKFINYLKCELETYSDKLLNEYCNFVKASKSDGVNLVEERYNNLFMKMGYESLADKESQEKHKEFWKNNTCRGC